MKLTKHILLVLFLLSPVLLFAQQQKGAQKHQHKAHLQTMIQEYLAAQQALAADDMETAGQHIQAMQKEAMSNNEMKKHQEHAERHRKHHGEMVAALTKASSAEDVAGMREAFKDISEHLIMAAKKQGLEETLYVQYCPMAKASWLSKKKEIRNPYYGSSMLKCGTVKETLEANQ
jgi:Cu(I)/Ag(I) efflux system membrane fusion protein